MPHFSNLQQANRETSQLLRPPGPAPLIKAPTESHLSQFRGHLIIRYFLRVLEQMNWFAELLSELGHAGSSGVLFAHAHWGLVCARTALSIYTQGFSSLCSQISIFPRLLCQSSPGFTAFRSCLLAFRLSVRLVYYRSNRHPPLHHL